MHAHEDRDDWRDGFLFIGDDPAIDFVNTRLVDHGAPIDLLPDWAAAVRWFVAAGLVGPVAAQRLRDGWGDGPDTAKAFLRLATFREHLRSAIARISARGLPPKTFIDIVNRQLEVHAVPIQLQVSEGRLRRVAVFDPVRPDDLIAPLTEAAADLLVDGDPTRLRQCEGCVAYFYDRSKSGRRRWCSMRMCGNRAKVAGYAARRRRRAP